LFGGNASDFRFTERRIRLIAESGKYADGYMPLLSLGSLPWNVISDQFKHECRKSALFPITAPDDMMRKRNAFIDRSIADLP
jgi:hypothetical protein